jgi:DNA-binding LacI/PurR family transcriptional regulator
VLVPGDTEKAFLHPFFPEVLRGITAASHKNDYKVLISGVSDIAEEKKAIREFTRGGIAEGIILMTSRVADPSIAELTRLGFPFVVVGKPEKDKEINWVDNNNYEISYELTKHLLDQGHKQIAFLGVCPDFFVTIDRMLGYKQALRESGLPVLEDLIVESRFREDNGYDLMSKLLNAGKKPTAVITCDDMLAFGVLKSISELGLCVPKDIAVAGFNNVPLSEYCIPPLTSVEINPYKLGVKAVELLIADIISDHKSFDRAIIPAKLVIRKSTLI